MLQASIKAVLKCVDALGCLGPEYLIKLTDKLFMLVSRSLRCLSFLEPSDNQCVTSFLKRNGADEFVVSCCELIKAVQYVISQMYDRWDEIADLHFKELIMVRN